jgi:hypothetical protein
MKAIITLALFWFVVMLTGVRSIKPFVASLGGEQITIEFWQTRRDGRLRGIVEIVENDDDPK